MTIKEPMHPGKILKNIMMENGYCSNFDDKGEFLDKKEVSIGDVHRELDLYNYNFTKNLLNGEADINYVVAYKLGKYIAGTDMAFWIKLQKDYDDHLESSKEEQNDERELVNSIIKLQKRIGRPIESYDDYVSSYRSYDWGS